MNLKEVIDAIDDKEQFYYSIYKGETRIDGGYLWNPDFPDRLANREVEDIESISDLIVKIIVKEGK